MLSRRDGIDQESAKDRLLNAGKSLFADKGFSGTSVREICDLAGTSSTMIHHYFGSKKGLYEAIVEQFSVETFEVPLRVIAQAPRNREEFVFRMEMFIAETLEALIAQATVFRILSQDKSEFINFKDYHEGFVGFLEESKAKGFLRQEIDTEMISGIILDRLGNQVLLGAVADDKDYPNVLKDASYRKRWLAANIDVLINGFPAGTSN